MGRRAKLHMNWNAVVCRRGSSGGGKIQSKVLLQSPSFEWSQLNEYYGISL